MLTHPSLAFRSPIRIHLSRQSHRPQCRLHHPHHPPLLPSRPRTQPQTQQHKLLQRRPFSSSTPNPDSQSPSTSPPHSRPQAFTRIKSSLLSRLRLVLLTLSISLTAALGWYYITDTRSGIQRLAPRILHTLVPDAERSHEIGNGVLRLLYRLGLHPRERGAYRYSDPSTNTHTDPSAHPSTHPPSDLGVAVWDKLLDNPIAISAGLDKKGELVDALFALGASIVEIGGVTPRPQPGNEKPRVWRVGGEEALVNRYGLNSDGVDDMARRLRARRISRGFAGEAGEGEVGDVNPGSLMKGKLLAVNIAKNAATDNEDTEAVIGDYVTCVEKIGALADVLVVNVSSPNTRGLRGLQASEPLTRILEAVTRAAGRVGAGRVGGRASGGSQSGRSEGGESEGSGSIGEAPKIMVKISPDEASPPEIHDICTAIVSAGVDGVVVGNTTKSRPSSLPQALNRVTAARTWGSGDRRALDEEGGYSGPAMFTKTVELVGMYRRALDEAVVNTGRRIGNGAGRKVIFASGGIDDGHKVLQVLEAGASVAMMYTTLTYRGVGAVGRVKGEVRAEIRGGMDGEEGG